MIAGCHVKANPGSLASRGITAYKQSLANDIGPAQRARLHQCT